MYRATAIVAIHILIICKLSRIPQTEKILLVYLQYFDGLNLPFGYIFSKGSLELESQERHGFLLARVWLSLLGGTLGYRPGPESQGSVFWFTARIDRADTACSAKKPTMSPTDDPKDLMSKVCAVTPCKHILPSTEALSH